MALTNKLSAIGNAIREKTGSTELMTLDAMPAAIASIETGGGGGSSEVEEYLFNVTGNCLQKFRYDTWSDFISLYGDKIKTSNITNGDQMFYYCETKLTTVPFELNFSTTSLPDGCFNSCKKLTSVATINFDPNKEITKTACLFYFCDQLRDLPTINNFDASTVITGTAFPIQRCYSLRKIPEYLYKDMWKNTAPTTTAASYNCPYTSLGYDMYVMDELKDVPVFPGVVVNNVMTSGCMANCYRVKDFTFATNEDGTPKIATWKGQTLNLGGYLGFALNGYDSRITGYNSGITADKKVTDDATYQALKDDPDWWTTSIPYCRYNHDSAVNTINSLPDTSAYLAEKGGTNTIKFRGAAGSATDGGACNTLTEEEIAVAAAKGWTVTFT